MKLILKLSLILLTVTALTALPARAADDASSSPTTTAPATPKKRAAQFRGTISSVDATAMTLTAKNRNGEFKIKVTSQTKIFKGRTEPGTFADATEGMRATGSGVKDDDGNWTAHTLHLTTVKPKAATPPAASSDQKSQ